MQISIQLMLWALAAAIVAGAVALAFWAMQDQSLVIQPFKAPPLLSAQGLDGPVLAAKLLDGVRTLQGEASSARAPSTMKGAAEDDIKVEIRCRRRGRWRSRDRQRSAAEPTPIGPICCCSSKRVERLWP